MEFVEPPDSREQKENKQKDKQLLSEYGAPLPGVGKK
jgi:hypothetical protein